MQHVYSGRDEMDANFVKGLLQQEGIEAVITGQALEAAFSTLPLSDNSLPSVWVSKENEERAKAIIQKYQQVDLANSDDSLADTPRPTWKCANCGEAVEQQFTECWKCGHARPAEPDVVNPADGPH
jgi:hypothetical protein